VAGTVIKNSKCISKRISKSSISDRIGNTPLLRINRITNVSEDRNVEIYAKAEWLNPGGSVKDRPALRIIEDGEKSGRLNKDKIIVDSTSGNTGIAYALIGASKGYKVIFYFTKQELDRVNRILKDLKMEGNPVVILIDARRDNKPSGSKA